MAYSLTSSLVDCPTVEGGSRFSRISRQLRRRILRRFYLWQHHFSYKRRMLHKLKYQVDSLMQENKELFYLATTDPLTNLANRRLFFKEVHKSLLYAQEQHKACSVLLIDIDHFKQVNDTFGHDIGDKLLVEIAHILHSCIGKSDLVARLGGEEFGILLPNTSAQAAYWVAEHICRRVSHYCFESGKGIPAINCTVSIGVSSTLVDQVESVEELYKCADNRLYIAKNTGRNKVSLDEMGMH